MVAPNERMRPIIKPILEGSFTIGDEMETVKMTPAEEMATEKEVQRVGGVDSEMETDRMLPRSETVAEGVLVEDDAYKAGEAAPAIIERAQPTTATTPDEHRIAAVKNKIGGINVDQGKALAAEMKLAEDCRRFEVLTRNVADTKAKVAELSKGNFLVRTWNALMRREQETHLASYEKQLAEVTARHPEFTKPKLTVVQEAANDVVTPKSRWSTTEQTKTLYTVEQKLVKTRFENLQRTIRAKQELVTRLEKTEPQSATMRYEQNALTRLAQELDTVYTSNKAFIDSLPDDEPVEAKKRA